MRVLLEAFDFFNPKPPVHPYFQKGLRATPWSMCLVTRSMGRDQLVVLALGSIVSAAVTTGLMSIMLCSHLPEALRSERCRNLPLNAPSAYVARTCFSVRCAHML